MPPRPLHRWKSFWLGVFVLVFFGWAWVRSMSTIDYVRWRSFGLGQASSSLYIYLPREPISAGGGFELASEPESDPGLWFPEAVGTRSSRTQIEITIAHWFLILLFLLPWITFLVWRSRRMKRLD